MRKVTYTLARELKLVRMAASEESDEGYPFDLMPPNRRYRVEPSFVQFDPKKMKIARNLKVRLNPIADIRRPRMVIGTPEKIKGESFIMSKYLKLRASTSSEVMRFIETAVGGLEGPTQIIIKELSDGTIGITTDLNILDELGEELVKESRITKKLRRKVEQSILKKMRLLFHPEDLETLEDPEVLWYVYHAQLNENSRLVGHVDAAVHYFRDARVAYDEIRSIQDEAREALAKGAGDYLVLGPDLLINLVRLIDDDETVIEWGLELQAELDELVRRLGEQTPEDLLARRGLPSIIPLIDTYTKIAGYVRGHAFIDPTYKVPLEMKNLCQIMRKIVKKWARFTVGKKLYSADRDWKYHDFHIDEIRFILSDEDKLPPSHTETYMTEDLRHVRYFLEEGCGSNHTGYLDPTPEPAPRFKLASASPVASATRGPRRRRRSSVSQDI